MFEPEGERVWTWAGVEPADRAPADCISYCVCDSDAEVSPWSCGAAGLQVVLFPAPAIVVRRDPRQRGWAVLRWRRWRWRWCGCRRKERRVLESAWCLRKLSFHASSSNHHRHRRAREITTISTSFSHQTHTVHSYSAYPRTQTVDQPPHSRFHHLIPSSIPTQASNLRIRSTYLPTSNVRVPFLFINQRISRANLPINLSAAPSPAVFAPNARVKPPSLTGKVEHNTVLMPPAPICGSDLDA